MPKASSAVASLYFTYPHYPFRRAIARVLTTPQ